MSLLSALWQLPRRALVAGVRGYRLLLSPSIGQDCRFTPTCSRYAIEALERHGAVVGGGLAVWRILRCNPLCRGGCDPVPDNRPWARTPASSTPSTAAGLFTRLLPLDSGIAPTAAKPAASASADPTLSKTPP